MSKILITSNRKVQGSRVEAKKKKFNPKNKNSPISEFSTTNKLDDPNKLTWKSNELGRLTLLFLLDQISNSKDDNYAYQQKKMWGFI